MIAEPEVNKAYEVLAMQTQNHANAVISAINTKATYDRLVASALANGEIEGKNAEIRTANAQEKFAFEFRKMNDAQDEERAARLDLDLARIEVERVRALLRLMELTSRTE